MIAPAQRPALLELADALGSRDAALRRDEYGDWAIFPTMRPLPPSRKASKTKIRPALGAEGGLHDDFALVRTMNSALPAASNAKRIDKGALVGTFDLTLQSGLKINGCMLLQKGDKRWVSLPQKEWTDKNGAKQYVTVLEFVDRATADKFQALVLPLAEQVLS